MNKVRNFLYVYTGLRSLTNAIKHWLGMTMLEAKFNQLHDEYADTIDEKVDEIVEDKGRDLEYELESQLSDAVDEKYSNDITSAVEEYADDVLPSLVAKSIDNTDVFTDVEDLLNRVNDIEATQEASLEPELSHDVDELKAKVEALEKFIEVLVDKQSWFFDEVESSSDSLRRIALLTNSDVSIALQELKGEK
jgi:polyhydroxyalkanoate synthesis regulator phasin|tara:strand:- start:207 stop:785 length:579 start_codon:yes stop_codon:yes gene_type:complete